MSISNPASNSADVSGFRLALPGLLAARTAWSVPVVRFALVMVVVVAEKVWSPAVAPGCTPLAPYALRSRRLSSHENFGKKSSSEAIHDTLAFGYSTFWKLLPNALFWSW